uniref:Uncharacterized protein n=1 Tax=viral metagenome TaxID=1070528 RepID=A0A6M3XEV3_9ZZZZ
MNKNKFIKRWRKNPQVGDKVYFINIFGEKVRGEITNINLKDNTGSTTNKVWFLGRGVSGAENPDDLYPYEVNRKIKLC